MEMIVVPENRFPKNVRHGAVTPKKRPQCFKSVAFWGYFFLYSHFPPLILTTPFPSPTSPLSHFSPPFSSPKRWTRNFAYRGQNALSVMKTHERINDSEHILYLSVRQSILAGRITFSTCPFLRPFVRLFVRSSVTNLWTLLTSKTNEPI